MSDSPDDPPVPVDDAEPWQQLRRLTAARIGLKRAGASLATAPLLAFQLAHARARDAVHATLDVTRLADELARVGDADGSSVLTVASAAPDKQTYLIRPDLGRSLHPDGDALLTSHLGHHDIVFVVTDGLSAGGAQKHAAPVLDIVAKTLAAEGWRIAPLVIVERGRVAIGDRIAARLGADCAVVLIGERPGLSAPESMGAYLTWHPTPETTDADRNCISNIRPGGIGYADAAFKLAHLLRTMRARGLSGVRLKDDAHRLQIDSL